MKIFGKKARKSTGGGDADTTASTGKSPDSPDQQEDVPSYFGSADDAIPLTKSNKPGASKKANGDDIETLLAMDPSNLNSKQRRLVRRHEERSGKSQNKTETTETCIAGEDDGASGASSSEQVGDNGGATDGVGRDGIKANETVEKDSKDSEEPMSVLETSEILKKLDGLNSKERRKLLRQLKRQGIDESVVLAAEEQAKKVASRNEKESAVAPHQVNTTGKAQSKRKSDDSSQPEAADSDSKPKRRRKRGRKVDLDSLTPEERARREEQRRMQIEAAERRAKGLVDPNRHPLNSERRRANRRKPGPSAIIAMQKREKARQKSKFNSYGYHMRKGGFDQPEG